MHVLDDKNLPSLAGNTHGILKQTATLMLALMTFIFFTILFTLIQTKSDLQQTEQRQKMHLLTKALENRQENLRLHLADYANWDDAFQNLTSTVNVHWAWDRQNLGKSLFNKFQYEGVFVLSPDGVTRYSVLDGQPGQVSFEAWLGVNLTDSLITTLANNQGIAFSRLITIHDQPTLVAASWITSDDYAAAGINPSEHAVMIFVDKLTPQKFQQLGDEYEIKGLHTLPPEVASMRKDTMFLTAGNDRIYVEWQSKNPVETLLSKVLPLLVLLMVVSVLLAISLMRKALTKARMNDEKTFLLEQSRAALSASEQRFRDIVETTTDWIWEANENFNLTWISARFPVITGHRIDEWLGRSFTDFLVDSQQTISNWLTLPHPGDYLTLSHCCYVSALGSQRYCNITLKRITLPDGAIGFRGTASDVTLEVESSERIRFLSHHDELTGLPNRAMMQEFLDGKLHSRGEANSALVMLSLDLTDFKLVNDIYGHDAGDKVLGEVAQRLRNCLRATDLVARQGGDEFIIIAPAIHKKEDIRTLCQLIIAVINKPFIVSGNEVSLGVNIGAAQSPQDALTASDLLRYSDIALYEARNLGNNSFVLYQADMAKQIVQRRELENELREAIKENQLFLVYQPRFDIRAGCINSVEALVRWLHPRHGLLMPDQFIPLAEESGIITDLTDWVLVNACQDIGREFNHISVSVNISPMEFKASDVIARIKNVLATTHFPAARLELEVTENVTLCSPENAQIVMQELKTLGIRLLIDDFGTGYASLYYLHSFPFHGIKIDKSFIFAMNDSESAKSIVEKVIGLGKDYNLEVTAEGVETQEQLQQLIKYKCDIAQGYYIGRPVSLEAVKDNLHIIECNIEARCDAAL
ncbi:hypothetical protein UYSO10_2028 [Kosakonia radicincitans]|uniref:bifunctional diguanylate cyclase/phosphodiesterase n=1 Tax=Kosakonia radicincitans TaxID=283686 RepID=UPI00118367AE|nr:EAL domain-containing protein [Kosakonia radicincitans]VVT48096.1 hypothetical protein UYSO10_2028 [Kosakonia radicincitans]